MNIRTDLALEMTEALSQSAGTAERLPEGVEKSVTRREGLNVTTVSVKDSRGASALGKPVGMYITLEVQSLLGISRNFEGEVTAIAEAIGSLLPQDGLVLVVGLGNSDITPDSLGPLTARQVLATRHISQELAQMSGLDALRPVAAIAPGVLGQTGIESSEIISSICKDTRPAAVMVVDALASRSVDRLGCTVQVTNTGISPGSGVQNRRKELSVNTLGVPVVSLGIPMVVDMTTIAYDLLGDEAAGKVSERGRTMIVTPREVDSLAEQAAKTLAASINRALQPTLTMEEIMGLTG